jgi:hypothetical protein
MDPYPKGQLIGNPAGSGSYLDIFVTKGKKYSVKWVVNYEKLNRKP